MTDKSTEIGILIFQFIFERQHDEWTTTVQLKPICSAISIFTRYSGIRVSIKSCIYKALVHSVAERQSNE